MSTSLSKATVFGYFFCNIWLTLIVLFNWLSQFDGLWIIPGIWALVTNYGCGAYFRKHLNTSTTFYKFAKFCANWCCIGSTTMTLLLCIASIVIIQNDVVTLGAIVFIIVTLPVGILYLIKRNTWLSAIAEGRRHY